MTTILFFLCSLRTLSVGWDETNPFTLFSLLFFYTSWLQRTEKHGRRRTETARPNASLACVTFSHHSSSPRAGYSFAVRKMLLYACRIGTLMVFWKVGTDSRWSRRYSYVHLPIFTFLGKGRKAFACAKRVHKEETLATFWAGRPITFLSNYLISKNSYS
jgi:hypothetical protein